MRKHRVLSLAIAGLLVCAAVQADTLLTWRLDADDFSFETQHSGGKNQTVLVWIGADRVKQDNGYKADILRLDQKRLYRLDHEAKTYTVVELVVAGDELRARPAGRSADPRERGLEEAQKAIAETFQMHATITPTTETRKVGSWQAHKFNVELASAVSSRRARLEWWSAPDLKLDDNPAARFQLLLASLSLGKEGWMADLLARAGEPVLVTRVQILPDGVEVRSTEELRSIAEKAAPEGTYEPPPGYRWVNAWDRPSPSPSP